MIHRLAGLVLATVEQFHFYLVANRFPVKLTRNLVSWAAGADLGGRVQGVRTPPTPEMTCSFLIQVVFCEKKKLYGLLVLK